MVKIIAIVGRGRTGTNLLMKVLTYGGLEPIKDEHLTNHHGNPEYFECLNPILSFHNRKTFIQINYTFCQKFNYIDFPSISSTGGINKVLFTTRPEHESIASADSVFPDRTRISEETHAEAKIKCYQKCEDFNIPYMEVPFHKMIDHPREMCQEIADFLDMDLDVEAMAKVPDKKHRHFGP